jgi:hypothetical protein
VSQGLQGSFPEDMPPEQVTLEWFARMYHFSDETTRALGIEALEWWPLIAEARAKAQVLESERDRRMQASTSRRH